MNKKSVYLIGIGGIGMSALAHLFKKSGWDVLGSDKNIYPPSKDLLIIDNIRVFNGFSPENIPKDLNLCVIGNSVSKNNSEVLEVLRRGIKFISLPEALNTYFINNKKTILITGTHGKTTLTSLITHILLSSFREPGYFIGGLPIDIRYPSDTGKDFFVLEGDEYDTSFFDKTPKFTHFLPDYFIINSLELTIISVIELPVAIKSIICFMISFCSFLDLLFF